MNLSLNIVRLFTYHFIFVRFNLLYLSFFQHASLLKQNILFDLYVLIRD